mgnify:CR=1 FL=1
MVGVLLKGKKISSAILSKIDSITIQTMTTIS